MDSPGEVDLEILIIKLGASLVTKIQLNLDVVGTFVLICPVSQITDHGHLSRE